MHGGPEIGVVDPDIEAYAAAHTTPEDPLLAEVAGYTRNTQESHGMMVGLLEGRFLETLVWLSGARRVLEIGCFTGYSALSMAAVLPKVADHGLIVVDNVLWSGKVLDPDDQSEDTVAIRAFNDFVRDDPRVTCAMATVRDGVTLIRRR